MTRSASSMSRRLVSKWVRAGAKQCWRRWRLQSRFGHGCRLGPRAVRRSSYVRTPRRRCGALGKLASPNAAINKVAREVSLDVAFSRYGIDVLEHLPGKLNTVADALSRAFEPGTCFEIPLRTSGACSVQKLFLAVSRGGKQSVGRWIGQVKAGLFTSEFTQHLVARERSRFKQIPLSYPTATSMWWELRRSTQFSTMSFGSQARMVIHSTAQGKVTEQVERGLPLSVVRPIPEVGALFEGSRSSTNKRTQAHQQWTSPTVDAVISGERVLPSAPKKSRWDLAVVQKPATHRRGSLAEAVRIIGNPHLADEAEKEFGDQTLAVSTRPVYASRHKILVKLASAGGFDLLPMTKGKLYRIGGALKRAGYRSIGGYMIAYKKAHIEARMDWGPADADFFRSARLSAKRGLGPSKQAEIYTRESWEDAAVVLSPVVKGGPMQPGPFINTGTWWLLREIEASLLRLSQVEIQDEGRLVIISLSGTKTDPEGRGFKRAHRCLCDSAPEWFKVCPACGMVQQVSRRNREGASGEDPLFPTSEGGFASKNEAARTLKKLLIPDGPGEIGGHSMRRCGAQTLTAAGVEPWLVEWFGRWGSAAIRVYIEDARARAPNVSQLALRVAKPGANEGYSSQAQPASGVTQVASLEADTCASATNGEKEQVHCDTGLSKQTCDAPTNHGTAYIMGEASMFRGVLSHAGLREVVEGVHLGTVRKPRQDCQVHLLRVRQDPLGIGASSGGRIGVARSLCVDGILVLFAQKHTVPAPRKSRWTAFA